MIKLIKLALDRYVAFSAIFTLGFAKMRENGIINYNALELLQIEKFYFYFLPLQHGNEHLESFVLDKMN